MFTERKTWSDAAAACRGLNSHLIEPRTEEVNTIAKSFDVIHNPWIGASDIQVEGQWVWASDGELVTLTYTDWAIGQPNNLEDQHCAAYQTVGGWGDNNCTKPQQFICQTDIRT